MRKTSTKVTIIIILVITAVVGYYSYLANRRLEIREEGIMTPVEITLTRDLSIDYPSTPKEVIKYYNQILKCLYNEECSDEEIDSLGVQARALYDAELLQINEFGSYMINLKAEVEDYKAHKRRISNCAVAASTSVDKFTEDGYEFARISSGYTVLEGSQSKPTTIVYLLRRDEDKKWKIYGWDLAENVNLSQKTEE